MAVVATEVATASLYIERRATPATDMGVQGIPMIASAFRTKPKSATERKTTATASIVVKNDFIDLLLPLIISPRRNHQGHEGFRYSLTKNLLFVCFVVKITTLVAASPLRRSA